MSAAIDIPPPLTCGACGALVDERQASHRWPQDVPAADGDYLVLVQEEGGRYRYACAHWFAGRAGMAEPGYRAFTGWLLPGPHGAKDITPLAWRHLPPLPEWLA